MRSPSPSVAAALLLLVAPAAWAQTSRAAAERALAGYETRLTRETLQALGVGWEQALVAIASDASAKPLLRVRALSGLGFARSAPVAAFLANLAAARRDAADPAALLELAQALRSLAVVQGAAADAAIAPFLQHATPDVRVAAGQALILSGAPRAMERVRSRLKSESDPAARAGLQRALQAPAAPR